MNRRMRARGFTLLEVLVALLIVAITLSAATAAVGGAALRQRGLEERTFATWAAQNTLNRVRLNGLPGDRLEQRQALAGVNWRVDVQARTEHSMRRLELVVRRVGEAQPLARLTGFLPVPVPVPVPVQESEAQQPPMRVPGPEPEQPP